MAIEGRVPSEPGGTPGRPRRPRRVARRPEGRATLSLIAREAGVSLATVSKVVNGRPDVAPATRARVEHLLMEHRYVPVGSRGTATSGLVDVVFHALDSPWAIEILRGITAALTAQSAQAVVLTMPGPDDASWPRRLILAGHGGLIVVTSTLTSRHRSELAAAGVPFIVIDPVDLPDSDVSSVGATNWAGGLAATEHLISLGHRRIGAIGGLVDLLCSRARLDGYRAALDKHGLPFDTDLVRYGDFHHEGGFVGALSLLDRADPPTAIFAGSDQQAFGVIEAARVRGLRVPEDLSVVGFDDLPVARWASPPLTTVRQPLADMGRMAARMLLRTMAGKRLDSSRVELATELVIRESTTTPTHSTRTSRPDRASGSNPPPGTGQPGRPRAARPLPHDLGSVPVPATPSTRGSA